MKKLILLSFLLTACNPLGLKSDDSATITLEEHMQNPLFAEEYSKTMVNVLTELIIDKDTALEDEKIKNFVEEEKRKWKEKDRSARKLQQKGRHGQFIRAKEHTAGQVLLLDNILFFDLGFSTMPGPNLEIYLSEETDPRDIEFPDASSVSLGRLESPMGAQSYRIPEVENYEKLRTVVLYDESLKRIYGFAQLSN